MEANIFAETVTAAKFNITSLDRDDSNSSSQSKSLSGSSILSSPPTSPSSNAIKQESTEILLKSSRKLLAFSLLIWLGM